MADDGGSCRLNELLSLEHSTLKVPYEILNKKFRSTQKTFDREAAHLNTAATVLESHLHRHQLMLTSSAEDGGAVSTGEVCRLLDNISERLVALKRKSEECIGEELGVTALCKRRLHHLMEYGATSPGAVSQWRRRRTDRLLVDHLVRCGFYDLASELGRQADVLELTNIDVFLVAKQVNDSLLRHETGAAIAWCHDNKSKLRKNKSKLELYLRQQEFIELIKAGRRLEAVIHARKYLSNMEEFQSEDIQSCMTLLAFPVDTDIEPYCSLFSDKRWDKLMSEFYEENFRIYQLSPLSVFSTVMQGGLSALKTQECYRRDGKNSVDCPVCHPPMNDLASSLPFAHCTQSRLRCAISGDPIDEHNPPMMLPNGNVYGKQALRSMAAEMDSRVVCPRTQEVFSETQLEKVFVM